MTIINSVEDRFYNDDEELGRRLAEILNKEILALAQHGCEHIQVGPSVILI